MKKLIISLSVIACGFTISPVKAHPPDDQFTADIMNMGRTIGWLQSTCAMGILGSLSAPRTEFVLRSLLDQAEENDDRNYAKFLVDNLLKKYPKCLKYFPREYLID